MKMAKKVIAALLCVLVLGALFTACSKKDSVATIKEKGVIVMGTNAEFEPFEYRDNGEITGIDVEIAQALAEKMGVELKIEDMAFDSLVGAIGSGKIDFIAAGMTADPDRDKNVDFSDGYYDAYQAIIVKEGSDIKGSADLAGKKIGVQQGTTGDIYCSDEVEGAEVSRYSKGSEAILDLINGKIDCVVIDNFPAMKFVSKNEGLTILEDKITSETYSIAVGEGDEKLLAEVNAVIKELKADGTLDAIIQKYVDMAPDEQ